MVGISKTMKIGPKGQVVIPKVFRENHNMHPGDDVIMHFTDNGLAITKNSSDIVQMCEDMAEKVKQPIHDVNYWYKKQMKERFNHVLRQ